MWSKTSNELVSTHGYSGGLVQNQVCIWKYPTMTQVATLTGHTYRVLYLAMSRKSLDPFDSQAQQTARRG